MTNKQKLDAHARISYVKSGLRFIGYGFLIWHHFFIAGVFLGLAEGLGVLEEAIL